MSKITNPYIEPLLKRWQKRLDLSDWSFELQETTYVDSDGSWAEVSAHVDLRSARIRYIRGLSFSETRNVLIHELLHVVHCPVRDMAMDALKGNEVAIKEFDRRKEEYICHMERCLEKIHKDKDLK